MVDLREGHVPANASLTCVPVGSHLVQWRANGTPLHSRAVLVQVIIPMSGFGERFRRAGYAVPKPLIEIDGKPIIAHVMDMFPGETDVVFICNREHLDEPGYALEATLLSLCPTAQIVRIAPHKLGPVHAVLEAAPIIAEQGPVVINYCDFTCFWDWSHFREFVQSSKCAGAIPAYRGFHPHSLGTTNYAYMRERGGWVTDIREKEPFTSDRMNEYASSGTYYFESGARALAACRFAVERSLLVGGEYYMSLAYRHLFEEELPVAVYPLQHFMQWGTPEDVAEYRAWSAYFRDLVLPEPEAAPPVGSLVVPMAGLGQRFRDAGYEIPKPAISVSGRPMVVQAASDVGVHTTAAFVVRDDMEEGEQLAEVIGEAFPDALIVHLPSATDGQAITALAGLDALEGGGMVSGPVTFAACDNGVLGFPIESLEALLAEEFDVLVWGARGHSSAVRHPTMFGWIDERDGHISGVSVKEPLSDPSMDPVVIGTFTFRTAGMFRQAVQRLIHRDGRVNGEYYIDSCINDAVALGLRCRLLEVDHYVSWGTPNDLQTFEYWQSCFHKWASHPYRLEDDSRVASEAILALKRRCAALTPVVPSASGASRRSATTGISDA